MKTWCIVDLSELHNGYGDLPDPTMNDTGRLDKKHCPTMFYYKRKPSEDELFRLQKKYPAGKFHLFEAVGKVVESQVNTKAAYIENIQ